MSNRLRKIFFHTIVLMASMTGTAMAVEEAQYQVIRTDDKIEIREYAPSIVAETIPQPDDPAVVLRPIPKYRAAAIRYSGFWSEKNYAEQLEKLQAWISKNQLETTGSPVWARYNAPFTPWFMRRNEILVPIL